MKHLFLGLIAGTGLIFAAPKMAPDIPNVSPSTPVEVIVRFKSSPTKDDLKLLGPYGQVKRTLDVVNAVHIALPRQALDALAANPSILYISPNRPLTSTLDVATQAANANLAWSTGWTGTGVAVAVIDSGIALKHDFTGPDGVTSRVVYSQSFVAGQDATDAYGHGTHVAGIIGSSGIDSTGSVFFRTFKGIAPNVKLVSLKVLDQNGGGQESDVIAAIQTAISLKNIYNIRVINLSLGRPVFESYKLDPLCQAVEAAWNAGITVVVAAGNSGRDNSHSTYGYGTIASPGNDPYVITVGAANAKGTASRLDDAMASYSSKGPTAIDHLVKPDLVAPGNGMVSVLASPNCTLFANFSRTRISNSYYQMQSPSGYSTNYFQLSGTSMATPVVSGAAALLIQKNPSLTPAQVKARLMKTAAKTLPMYSLGVDLATFLSFSIQADIFTIGAGYVDIAAALANNDRATLQALSPVATYDSASHKVSILRDFTVVWGDNVVWGDTVVWGSAVFAGKLLNGASVVWGDTVVWGTSTAAGFNVVWGDSTNLNATPMAMSDADRDL